MISNVISMWMFFYNNTLTLLSIFKKFGATLSWFFRFIIFISPPPLPDGGELCLHPEEPVLSSGCRDVPRAAGGAGGAGRPPLRHQRAWRREFRLLGQEEKEKEGGRTGKEQDYMGFRYIQSSWYQNTLFPTFWYYQYISGLLRMHPASAFYADLFWHMGAWKN